MSKTRSDSQPPKGSDPADALYSLPLEEFTPARNALISTLKKDGRQEQADRLRALGRPSLSAWVVNQLYWQDRKRFEALVDAGERFRRAQQAQLAGKSASLVAALDSRRDVIAALNTSAAHILRRAGHTPTTDMMRRITSTLEAIAAHGRGPGAPRHGRLTADVPPPGFEALAALVPRIGARTGPGHGTKRVLAFGDSKDPKATRGRTSAAEQMRLKDLRARRAQAAASVRDAERALARTRIASKKARDYMKSAAAVATARELDANAAAAHAERTGAAAAAARHAARASAERAEAVVQALKDAEATLARAKAVFAKLEK
jgi:hypothetical protein